MWLAMLACCWAVMAEPGCLLALADLVVVSVTTIASGQVAVQMLGGAACRGGPDLAVALLPGRLVDRREGVELPGGVGAPSGRRPNGA